MAANKQGLEIVGYFQSKVETTVPINRYGAQWAARDLVDSYGIGMVKDMIDYYSKHGTNQSWYNFTYSAEKIYKNMLIELDDTERREMMKKNARVWIGDE